MNQKDFFPNKKTKGNFVLTTQYCFKNGPQTDHLVKTFSANLYYLRKNCGFFLSFFFPISLQLFIAFLDSGFRRCPKVGFECSEKTSKSCKNFFQFGLGEI